MLGNMRKRTMRYTCTMYQVWHTFQLLLQSRLTKKWSFMLLVFILQISIDIDNRSIYSKQLFILLIFTSHTYVCDAMKGMSWKNLDGKNGYCASIIVF